MKPVGGRRCSAKGRRQDVTRSCLESSGFFAVYVVFFSGHGLELKEARRCSAAPGVNDRCCALVIASCCVVLAWPTKRPSRGSQFRR